MFSAGMPVKAAILEPGKINMTDYQFSILELTEDGEQVEVARGMVEESSLAKAFRKITGDHADVLIMQNMSLTIESTEQSVNWITVYNAT